MSETTSAGGSGQQSVSSRAELTALSSTVADQTTSFLIAVRHLALERDVSRTVPLLLLEVSRLLNAGARLGAQVDFVPAEEFEPDAGPDPDLDLVRQALADTLGDLDEYTEVFDPYDPSPELVTSRISDDVAAIAAAVAHGLQHHAAGRVEEALWWWQFSYVSSWGSEASAALRALQSVVAHDRLDSEVDHFGEHEFDETVLAAELP